MYSSTLSVTLALDGVCGQRHAPAALTLGKTLYPLYAGWAPRAAWGSPPPGFDPQIVQPVVSRYID